jgi:hypothetical protein
VSWRKDLLVIDTNALAARINKFIDGHAPVEAKELFYFDKRLPTIFCFESRWLRHGIFEYQRILNKMGWWSRTHDICNEHEAPFQRQSYQ